jgi:hypothetical protein
MVRIAPGQRRLSYKRRICYGPERSLTASACTYSIGRGADTKCVYA